MSNFYQRDFENEFINRREFIYRAPRPPQPTHYMHTPNVRRVHRHSNPAAAEHYADIGISERDRPRPDREHNQRERTSVINKRGQRECLPSWVTPVLQPDDEGGYYSSRDPQVREVHPSRCNVQRTTSNYYSGGLGDRAWRQKRLERCGVGLPDPGQAPRLGPSPKPGPPQHLK